MIIIGIDLSGPSNIQDTALSVFKETANMLEYRESTSSADDRTLLKCVSRWNQDSVTVVGIDFLKSQGLDGLDNLEKVTDHLLAACAAALCAKDWAHDQAVWKNPAAPPYHPYDYAC